MDAIEQFRAVEREALLNQTEEVCWLNTYFG